MGGGPRNTRGFASDGIDVADAQPNDPFGAPAGGDRLRARQLHGAR